jgi:hypothetical protein
MSKTQRIDVRELITRTKARSPEFFLTYAEVASAKDKGKVVAEGLPLFARLDEAEKAAIYTRVRRSQGDLPQDLPHRKLLARRLFFLLAADRKVHRLSRVKRRERTAQAFANFWAHRSSKVSRCTSRIELMKLIGCYIKDEEASYLMCQQEIVRKANAKPLTKLLDLYTCSGELEFSEIKGRKAAKLGSQRGEFWDLGRDGGGQHELRFRITSTLPRAAVSIVQSLGQITRNGGHIHMNCKGDAVIGERVFHALRYHIKWVQWLCPMVRRKNRFCHVENVSLKFADAKNDNKYAAIAANTWDRTGTVEMRVWPASADAGDWTGRAALMRSIAKWSERTPEYFTDASLGSQGIYEVGAVSDDSAVNERENFLELAEWMTEHDMATLRWLIAEMKDKAKGEPARNGRVDQEGVTRCYELLRAYEECDLRKPLGFRRMRKPYWVDAGFTQAIETPDSSTTRRTGLSANRNPNVPSVNPLIAVGCTPLDGQPMAGVYRQTDLYDRIALGTAAAESRIEYQEAADYLTNLGTERMFCAPNGSTWATSNWTGPSDGSSSTGVLQYLGTWTRRSGSSYTRTGDMSVAVIASTRPEAGASYVVGERASLSENILLPHISQYAEFDIIEVPTSHRQWMCENGEWHRVVREETRGGSAFSKIRRTYGAPSWRQAISTTYVVS